MRVRAGRRSAVVVAILSTALVLSLAGPAVLAAKSPPGLARFMHAVGKVESGGNYKARNNMRAMKVGDGVLYYHSNAKPPGVVGIARVCREAYPDPTQFDRKSKYHDEKSDPSDPRWSLVDVAYVAHLPHAVSLSFALDPTVGAVVCRQQTCRPPVSDPEALHDELSASGR